ncbi:hypothetical protein [Tunturibacter empetritectus]|uniref:Uncharacterized protein n=1 Tax=Tunturiibacter empetritectus TaxID=3069691 RepID=A0A7W8MS14_9BACT|nr:hypothetical protein [Edaphobacter lichenicola]MBB5318446.1 hypothetical protein [Edaphobacter lichenicola]
MFMVLKLGIGALDGGSDFGCDGLLLRWGLGFLALVRNENGNGKRSSHAGAEDRDGFKDG